MEFNSPLNLVGNQILNFVVHNGDATTDSKLPAVTGRLVYDTTNNSFYGGTSVPGADGANVVKWTRLVDTDHLSELSGFAKAGDVITSINQKSNNNFQTGRTYSFNKKDGSSFTLNIPDASSSASGLLSSTNLAKINTIPSDIAQKLSEGSSAYNWGDHSVLGYAKIFKVDAAVVSARITVVNMATADISGLTFLYFNTASKTLYMSKSTYTAPEPEVASIKATVYEGWAASQDAKNGLASSEYCRKGVCLCVGTDIYRYSGTAWELIYSGADAALADRVKTIENIINVGDNTKQVIDTWDEMKAFLDGIEPSNNGLQTWMQNTSSTISALSDRVNEINTETSSIQEQINNKLDKPANAAQNGQYLVFNNVARWKDTKVVSSWTIDADSENAREESINISSLGTTDVVVRVYKRVSADLAKTTKWEEIMAATTITHTIGTGDGPDSYFAKITFGKSVKGNYKAVIIAM